MSLLFVCARSLKSESERVSASESPPGVEKYVENVEKSHFSPQLTTHNHYTGFQWENQPQDLVGGCDFDHNSTRGRGFTRTNVADHRDTGTAWILYVFDNFCQIARKTLCYFYRKPLAIFVPFGKI